MKISTYLLVILGVIGCQSPNQTSTLNDKVVIAHRGASGYLPEHTLASKTMAYAMNPDYIEQDVVLSKDSTPIVIHDIFLESVTNIASVFPERARNDGRYYVIDFTFEELKMLQVVERFNPKDGKVVYPSRFPKGLSRFGLHSLSEEIELIQGLNKSTGNNIGIYPEIKAPEFHHQEGYDISNIVLKTLSEYGYQNKQDKCILQCFDANELKRIRKEFKSELFLVQLMESNEEINEVPIYAEYADGLGPWYPMLADGKLMEAANRHQLKVHAYTLRKDQLPSTESFESLLNMVFKAHGVDGVFTDHPDVVIQYLNRNENE